MKSGTNSPLYNVHIVTTPKSFMTSRGSINNTVNTIPNLLGGDSIFTAEKFNFHTTNNSFSSDEDKPKSQKTTLKRNNRKFIID